MTQEEPLRIVHVVRQFHPGIGGMENFVEQLGIHQLASGHRPSVVTLDRIFDGNGQGQLPAFEEYRGIPVHRVPFKGSKRYPLAPAVLRKLADADLVHVHGVDFFCDYLAATAFIHRKPMVLTTHGGFFHTDFARTFKRAYFHSVTRLSLSRYAAVIACSEEDARTFRSIVGERLTLIPNPVDVEKFAGLGDPGNSTLIYFGRLAPNKEVGTLIDWFAELAKQGEQWKLIVAGKPMGVEMATLQSQINDLGLQNRIELHDTPSDAELRRLIGRSSVYVCASSYEGFGLAAVEGISAGLYPVLSDIPPFNDTLRRVGFGSSVQFDQPGSWAEQLDVIERDIATFRERFSRDLIHQAVAPFAWPAAIPAFDEVYQRVLGRTKRRIGDVRVDVLDRPSATDRVLQAADRGESLMVAFCNAHTANVAARNPAFRDALKNALVLNDGVGVDMASRALFGSRFPANLNGTDFVPHLLEAAQQPLRLFLVGAEPGAAEAAAEAIRRRSPKAEIVGTVHGFFSDRQDGEVLERIKASGANLVLVAMGQPRQELWAARSCAEIPGPVLCVGALFDFLAERVTRAPEPIRKMRLEWVYRLAQEPRRLGGRYLLGNIAFLTRVLRQQLAGSRY